MTISCAIDWLIENVPEYKGIWEPGNERAHFMREYPALFHACEIFEHCSSVPVMAHYIRRYVETMKGYHSPDLMRSVFSELVRLLSDSGQVELSMYALRFAKETGYALCAESGAFRL